MRAVKLLLSQAAAGLFLDPGLGKTSTVLATIKILLEKNLIKKVLIIAPLWTVYNVWPTEIGKWENFRSLRCKILHGAKKADALQEDADVYVINPEGLKWLMHQKNTPHFDVLVVDESSKFKDSSTQRFKLLKPLLPSFKRRWILTGTPCPNGIQDLFGQMYILDFGRSLGRYITHFRNQFMDNVSFGMFPDWRPKPQAYSQVVERISPLVLQLSAEDYLQMPELVNTSIMVDLPPSARKLYDTVERDFVAEVENGHIIAANAAVAGVKCRQVANGAVYNADASTLHVHDEKLGALESIVDQLSGAPALVLYEFDHDRKRILAKYPDAPVLGGGTSASQAQAIIERFNRGEVPILLGHPASMGHGLNLQSSCHHIVWYGIPWNLEHYDQAIARIYRQGQASGRVFVYHIVARGTLDERVLVVLQDKDERQQGLLAALHTHREAHYEE